MKSITIHSDGYGGEKTVIIDEDGNTLDGVRRIDLTIEAGEANRATIEVVLPKATVSANVDAVEWTCPLCFELQTHNCEPSVQAYGVHKLSGPLLSVAAGVRSATDPLADKMCRVTEFNPITSMHMLCYVNKEIPHGTHVDTQLGWVWNSKGFFSLAGDLT